MKQLNETFEDKEHQDLTTEKNKMDMNWHDFILFLNKFHKEKK